MVKVLGFSTKEQSLRLGINKYILLLFSFYFILDIKKIRVLHSTHLIRKFRSRNLNSGEEKNIPNHHGKGGDSYRG